MNSYQYQITISASAADVWQILTGSDTYKMWVKAFSPNSDMKGQWIQGSEVDFIDPNMGGTRALLEVVEPGAKIVARHIAVISKTGEVSTSGEMADKWIGSKETYQLIEKGDDTELHIEMVCDKTFAEMFNEAWPKALATIKQLCEQQD